MVIWQEYNNGVFLDEKCTNIFRVPLNAYEKIEKYSREVLSKEEKEKASRFRLQEDTKRYVNGKFFLRKLLSGLIGTNPSAIEFSYTDNKKPALHGQNFNISHSGNFTVIAISPFPIGVDIEFMNENFDYNPLLDRCFTDQELQRIHDIADFYTFWTRKEAVLKATGEGLTDNLLEIDCCKDIVVRNNFNLCLSSNKCDETHIISLAVNNLQSDYQYWNFDY